MEGALSLPPWLPLSLMVAEWRGRFVGGRFVSGRLVGGRCVSGTVLL